MKRIVSACLQQTQRFESEADCQSYLRTLQRKHIKHKLLKREPSRTAACSSASCGNTTATPSATTLNPTDKE